MPINYALMNQQYPKQKAALTRAINKWKKTGQAGPVADACYKALREWELAGGVWPDGWHRWNVALLDASGISLVEFWSVMLSSRTKGV